MEIVSKSEEGSEERRYCLKAEVLFEDGEQLDDGGGKHGDTMFVEGPGLLVLKD